MKECVLYKKLPDKKVQCIACNHRCVISEGKRGICGVRENVDGKLQLLVYGLIISENVDPIEKKPLYRFLPKTRTYSIGTVGCNFKCDFCQNYEISQLKRIVGKETTPEEIVERAIKTGCKSISYTYNEPTIFAEFVKDTAALARNAGLKNILVTNGYMTKEFMEFAGKYIDAMNIDLKSFNADFYKKICKGDIETTKNAIRIIVEEKKHLEVTFLLIEGYNDNENEFREYCTFIKNLNKNIVLHISRAFPRYKLDFKMTPSSLLKKFGDIAKEYLDLVYLGNI